MRGKLLKIISFFSLISFILPLVEVEGSSVMEKQQVRVYSYIAYITIIMFNLLIQS